MCREVLLAAFKKAEQEVGSSKKTHKSQHISDELWYKFKFKIDERTLRDYYNSYINNNEDRELKPIITRHLCRYLGFENYQDFILSKPDLPINDPPEKPPKGGDRKRRKYKIAFSIMAGITLIITIINYKSVYGYFFINSNIQRPCMAWLNDHYEKKECDLKGINIYFDQDLIINFKKVKNDTIHEFFGEGGEKDPLYWYYKKNNDVELYTYKGMHPVEKVPLKPITELIVRKYILKE